MLLAGTYITSGDQISVVKINYSLSFFSLVMTLLHCECYAYYNCSTVIKDTKRCKKSIILDTISAVLHIGIIGR